LVVVSQKGSFDKMKKLFFLLSFAVVVASCTTAHEDTLVANPKEFTTIKMVSNIDTVAISVDTSRARLYQIENGLVTRIWVSQMSPEEVIGIPLFLIGFGFILGLSVDKKF